MGVITFDGNSSNRFGIEVAAPPRYTVPVEDYTATHINGQTGDKIKSWRSYKNIDQEYTCNFIADNMMPTPGDANNDGVVNDNDVSFLKYWLGLNPEQMSDNRRYETVFNPRGFRASDVDSDGVVSSGDRQAVYGIIHHPNTTPPPIYHAENFFSVVGDSINSWLKPYYSKKEIDYKLKAYRIRGIFETNKDGYYRLEDSYFPAVYKKAIIKSDINIENLYNQAGAFKLIFNCDPRKYYKLGEQWIDSATDNPENPVINYVNGEVLTHTYLWEAADSNEGGVLRIVNNLRYPSSPLMRIFLNINDFDEGKEPDVLQIYINTVRGVVDEVRQLKFDLSTLDFGTREAPKEYALYIDFATCEVYFIRATKNRIISADTDDSQLTYIINNAQITSFSDHLTTEYPFTTDTGLLYPGINKIKVRFWKTNGTGNTVTRPRNFQIMPRWWTL